MDFAVQNENKRMRKDLQVLRSCQRFEKAVDYDDGTDTNRRRCEGNAFHMPGKYTSETRDHRMETNQPKLLFRSTSVFKKVLETCRVAVTQNLGINQKLKLVKNHIGSCVSLRVYNRNRGNLNYSIPDIDLNTEKSPGDLRRLVVTQTPVIDHQLTCKILKEYKF